MAVTVTKALVVQAPEYLQDETGTLIVARYVDVREFPFATAEERASVAPECKQLARRVGGRVILRVTTVDDKDTDRETDNEVTISEKVVEVRESGDVTVAIGRSQAFVLVNHLSSIGEKWADAVAARLQQALG